MKESMELAVLVADRLERRMDISKRTYELLGEALNDMEKELSELRLILDGSQPELPGIVEDAPGSAEPGNQARTEQTERTPQSAIRPSTEIRVSDNPQSAIRNPQSDDLCVCGHLYKKHAERCGVCSQIGCDCMHFTPANRAGAPGGAGQ